MKALKTFALLIAMLVLMAVQVALPQVSTTNTMTSGYQYANGYITGYYVNISFTSDSLLSQMTSMFSVPEFDGLDWVTNPVQFRLKAVGTYGTPKSQIYVLGCYNTATDTIPLDTIRGAATAQGEVDSTGFLTFNGKKAPLGYRVLILDRTADINTGYINLFWPLPETQIKAR